MEIGEYFAGLNMGDPSGKSLLEECKSIIGRRVIARLGSFLATIFWVFGEGLGGVKHLSQLTYCEWSEL